MKLNNVNGCNDISFGNHSILLLLLLSSSSSSSFNQSVTNKSKTIYYQAYIEAGRPCNSQVDVVR